MCIRDRVASAQEADRLVHDEILYGLRAVAMEGGAIPPSHVTVAAQRALAVLERHSGTQLDGPGDAGVQAASEWRGEKGPWFCLFYKSRCVYQTARAGQAAG